MIDIDAAREPLADAPEKRDDLLSRSSIAELLEARDQNRRVGPGERFFSSSAERVQRCGLSHAANPPHPFLTHGSRALERVEMKAHGVVRHVQTFGQIIDGLRALSQQREESSA